MKQSLVENLASSQQAVRDLVLSASAATRTVTMDAASVQLETQSRASTPSAAMAKSAEAKPSAKQQAPIFVITTETGERWTSSDGLIWTHK